MNKSNHTITIHLITALEMVNGNMIGGDGSRPHYRLDAWKEAMALVKVVYKTTQNFPNEETFGLVSQMRRAAVSIPSNLAEGAARDGRKEFGQFLNIAKGSLSELETQFFIARDLGYLDGEEDTLQLLERVSRLISGLHRRVKNEML